MKYLKSTVQDLRRKFAGSVPLPQQEKFSKSMLKLLEDKAQMEAELRKVSRESHNFTGTDLFNLKLDAVGELVEPGSQASRAQGWEFNTQSSQGNDLGN